MLVDGRRRHLPGRPSLRSCCNVMNRHPALRRADGVDPADRERRPADPGHRHRRRTDGARGVRHRLPGRARARRAPGGGRRGHPRAVDRRSGHARVAVLPARGRARVPDPGSRRRAIVIGGETPNGARLAGRIGDGWTTFDANFEQNLPLYLESLAAAGRRREDQLVLVGFQGDWLGDESVRDTGWIADAARRRGSAGGGRGRRCDRARPDHATTSMPWWTRSIAGGTGRRPCVRVLGGPADPPSAVRGRPVTMTPPDPRSRPSRPEPTHPCVRCGAPVGPGIGPVRALQPARPARHRLVDRCTASVFIAVAVAVIGLAVFARMARAAGVGPFEGSIDSVEPAAGGLAVTLTVRNDGRGGRTDHLPGRRRTGRSGRAGRWSSLRDSGPARQRTFQRTLTTSSGRPCARWSSTAAPRDRSRPRRQRRRADSRRRPRLLRSPWPPAPGSS